MGNYKKIFLLLSKVKISGFAEILWSCKSWRQFRTKEIEKRKKWRVDVLSADIRFDDRDGLIIWIFRQGAHISGIEGTGSWLKQSIRKIAMKRENANPQLLSKYWIMKVLQNKVMNSDLLIISGFWHGQNVTRGYLVISDMDKKWLADTWKAAFSQLGAEDVAPISSGGYCWLWWE